MRSSSQCGRAVTAIKAAMVLLALCSASCAHRIAAGPHEPGAPSRQRRAQILYYWGGGGNDRLDTASGTITVDCIPPLTVPFALADSDRVAILALADSVKFYDLPRAPAPERGGLRIPCHTSLLRIVGPHGRNTVVWDNCHPGICPERDRAERVGQLIKMIVVRTDAWKRAWSECGHHPAYM